MIVSFFQEVHMDYQKYTDSEKKALENVTFREVSQKYYESHIKMIPVHNLRLSRCSKCGRYFQYRGDLKPRAFEVYEDKQYCRDCWEKEQHLIQVPCRDCGKPITLFESRRQFTGRCRECWIKKLSSLRSKYNRYRPLLEDILKEKGIELEPPFTDGLDETGRPDHPIEDLRQRILPLRDNEYALYLIRAGDGLLAFPDNGIGLRYIKVPSSEKILEAADFSGYLLAAGSDGKDIYILTGKGELFSSNWDILKGELPSRYNESMDRLLGKKRSENGKPVQIIDLESFCLQKAGAYFTEEQIEAEAAEFCSHGITGVNSPTYYDPEAQKFFKVLTDGNYYHGYDVDYLTVSREKVLDELFRYHFTIDHFIDQCEAGQIPMSVIVSRLPWVEGPYSPPVGFGYGVHFV